MNWFKVLLASFFGFILGIGLLIGVFFIIALVAGASGKKQFKVKENSVLELKLGLEIPDRKPAEELNFGGNNDKITGLNEIVASIEAAKTDNKIKGILIRPELYNSGLATAEEIRNSLLDFKKSGKFIYSYGEVYTEAGYYISSVADKIVLNPKGMLEFNGFAAQIMLYKNMFQKLGVKFEVFKAGKYKGATEPFVNDQLSEPNKEQIHRYISNLFGHHLNNISKSRKIDSSTLAEIANEFKARNAALAKDLKLVDETWYEDQLEKELKTKTGTKDDDKLHLVSVNKYAHSIDKDDEGEKIAVIYCNGEINSGENESGNGIGSNSLAETIKKARLDKKIKAIVLRVNSPGGSSMASDVIAREVELAKASKPVVVSIGNVAASGGYYISCLADSIFAQPNSITGSIGVFALIANINDLYNNKLGLGYETVPTGKYADFGRPDKPLTVEQRAFIQNTVDDIYVDFISIVGKGRHLDTATVANLAQGHVYTALDAKQLGLIDGIGGLERAILAAARKAKLSKYRVTNLPNYKSPFERFFGKPDVEESMKAAVKSEFGELYQSYQQLKSVRNMTGYQMRLPFDLKID